MALDRSIANVDWSMPFPEAFVEVLCRLHSDHNPLLLRFGGLPLARGPRSFCFKAAWIDQHDYAELVKNSWHFPNITASLNKVKENSITFNHEVFGNIFQEKKHMENCLKGIQNYLEELIPSGIPSLKKNYNKNTTTSSSKKKCFGTKNLLKSGSNLEIKTLLSSMLKLSSEEKEIESIDFNSLVVLGPLIATFFKRRPKTISRISSVATNLTMIDLSMKALTLPLMPMGKFL
ncbi:hypothetical protein MTR_0036s0160 [Medicago truncatula]|uniref:Uncharacterized protein n=1 Tax=Medicago truncatula TaxID=3880 RepID=A0A072TID7_MEDTR|nr:hypothetical protein MTR_0036s0160 [Medicago truncatula]